MQRSKTGELTWIDLSAHDLDKQTDFYEGLFGWTHSDIPFEGGRVFRVFAKDGHNVGGMTQLTPDMITGGQPSTWNLYLAADDVDGTVAKAADLGGVAVIPPADVPGGGRMAVIQDPVGAYVFLWKPASPDPTVEYMLPGTLAWADLTTREPEKAADFYSDLVGWDVQFMETEGMPYWVANIDDEGEAGIMPAPAELPPEVPSYWMPYFGTADIDADFAAATSLGATGLVPPTQVSEMLIFAVLADPAGATFALLHAIGQPQG
jgi:predicted enzyme related to lactoylglutathione lyase